MLRALSFFLIAAVLPAAEVSFSKQIAPILVDQCVECHRAGKEKGGYRLDTVEQMLKAGDSESAPVIAGKPGESELLKLIVTSAEDDRMPKKADALPEKQVALIREWIAAGAKLDVADKKAALTSILPEKEKTQAPDKYPRPLPVTALALSPDGKTLVCSGYFEVTLWDVATGKLTGRIGGMPERVLGLAWSEGQLAVAGGVPGRSGEVWVINPAKPAERKRLLASRDCVLGLDASRDGKLLAAGGADNLLRCFEMPAGKLKWQTEPHADWITAVKISPGGDQIATASRDRTARRISSANGEVEATFMDHNCLVLSVVFSPDGKDVLSGDVEGTLRRWDATGAGKKDTTMRPAGRAEVIAVEMLDDATPVAATGNGVVTTVDPKARKGKDQLTKYEDRVNVLLVKGTRVISGCHDGKVRVNEVGKAEPVLEFVASPGW